MTFDQDHLDRELRELLSDRAAIIDDGFSDRVLRALPARRPRHSLRLAILISMTATGCVLGMFILPGGEVVHQIVSKIPRAGWLASLPVQWLLAFYVITCVAISAALDERAVERS